MQQAGAPVEVASFETAHNVREKVGSNVWAPYVIRTPVVTLIRLSEPEVNLIIIEKSFMHPSTAERIVKARLSYAEGLVSACIFSIRMTSVGGCAICNENYKLVLQVNGPVEAIELGHGDMLEGLSRPGGWSFEVHGTGECSHVPGKQPSAHSLMKKEQPDAEIVLQERVQAFERHRKEEKEELELLAATWSRGPRAQKSK